MAKPLELVIRVMEDDIYESGEDPIEGDWKYLRIEDLLQDFRRYGLSYAENTEGIQIKNPGDVNGPGIPAFYTLAGRQQDMLRDGDLDEDFSVVRKKQFPSSYQRVMGKSYGYPYYASLSLFTPEGKLAAADNSELIPIKIAILKNVLDLYIELKQTPPFREYPELLEGFK